MGCRDFIALCLAFCLATPVVGQEPAQGDELFRQAAALETQGGAPKSAEAVRLYDQAARQGHVPSMVRLGYLLQYGPDVAQDSQRALALFIEAAKAGNPDGQLLLAMSLAQGMGTAKDPVKARQWLLLPAAAGSQLAQFNLGVMMLKGEGGETKLAGARRWLDRASSGPDKVLAAEAARLRNGVDKNLLAPNDSGDKLLAAVAALIIVGLVVSAASPGAGGPSSSSASSPSNPWQGVDVGTGSGSSSERRCTMIPISRSGLIVHGSPSLSNPNIDWVCR